uniref:39S ribosomal protein L20, mitochondrial n=1 Tax=Arion vulgaris TaxID=1028688 RepID=A0A0B7BU38_9EUPU
MVFLTSRLFLRKKVLVPYPEREWKREMQWRLAWLFRGRVRNCYKLSKNAVKRSLMFSTAHRPYRRSYILSLFSSRIAAGCGQHGIQYTSFMKSLYESNILLNKKMLAHFSAFEPRTFQSLCEFVKKKHSEDLQQGLATTIKRTPSGIITKDMISQVVKS